MGAQGEFNYVAQATEHGYARWVTARKLRAAALARQIGLPLGWPPSRSLAHRRYPSARRSAIKGRTAFYPGRPRPPFGIGRGQRQLHLSRNRILREAGLKPVPASRNLSKVPTEKLFRLAALRRQI